MRLKLILLSSLLVTQVALPAAKELIKLGGAVKVTKNVSRRALPMISRTSMAPWGNLDPADRRNYLALGVMATLAATAIAVNTDTKSEVQILDFDIARDTKFVIDCVNDSDHQIGPDHRAVIRSVLKHDFSQNQAIACKKAGGWVKYLKLIFVDGHPAGFIFYQSGPETVATIEVLAVHSDYRRKGCATKLLEYTIAQLQLDGKTKVSLSVFVGNQKAITLYNKLGFKPIGKSAWYEGEQVELVDLAKDISKQGK